MPGESSAKIGSDEQYKAMLRDANLKGSTYNEHRYRHHAIETRLGRAFHDLTRSVVLRPTNCPDTYNTPKAMETVGQAALQRIKEMFPWE